ncbi:uncharacterized protein B4U80_03276 [Leptotrombidium deliense]|uniref:SCP domain-containing protein n=1 Tax=Leptotrombidium deliense TaxID=299467 RepID=A0A443S8Z3_9ACAR|nr:uncharacterized protein B4U80_03276 [Leptotrombidium deliense]
MLNLLFFASLLCLVYSDFNNDCLTAHNNFRISERKPLLQLNDMLLKWSKKRALEMAEKCVFDHNGNTGSGYGENIAYGLSDCAEIVAKWNSEKELYDKTKPIYTPETANYTQITWRDTRYVGCSIANTAEECRFNSVTVCNYYKPGNKEGQFSDNV